MSITGIENISGSTGFDQSGTVQNNPGTTGMDQFLTLLVAQLEHQDPLNPMDSSDFTAQLAQFSSVEQLYGMNQRLADIQETLGSQNQQQDLVGLIGKTIKADDNTVLVQNGKVLSGSYSLSKNADVFVLVRDQAGNQVRALDLGRNDAGEHPVTWDGRDDNGNPVDNGMYYFDVSARDEYGNLTSANTYVSGEVTGLTYQYGKPYLMIGDRLINSDSGIVEISQPTADNG